MKLIKLIIEIPYCIYEMVTNTGTFGCYRFDTRKAIKNVTPLPDNATNGDVIKAMFPNGTTAKFVTFMRFIDGEHYFNCSEEWWNAPYQKGGKE